MTIKKVKGKEADLVAAAIKLNDGYCVCTLYKEDDTKCICKTFIEMEISENGYVECNCGLYRKYNDM